MIVITRRHALALGSTTLLLPSALRAQSAWPTGPVTFVVGYAAGGSSDINARELAQFMSPIIGQQIIIDNKGGATGSIGLRAVANAKPDGQTLFFAVGTNVVINPWVQKGMIDTIASLAPICQTTSYQYVLAVNPKVPANTAAELVALAKKDPEKLTFSSSGVGGNNHLAGALFAEAAGRPAHPRALQGHRAGAGRRDQRPDHHEFLLAAARGRPDQGRQPQGAGGDRRQARQARCPTCRRSRNRASTSW